MTLYRFQGFLPNQTGITVSPLVGGVLGAAVATSQVADNNGQLILDLTSGNYRAQASSLSGSNTWSVRSVEINPVAPSAPIRELDSSSWAALNPVLPYGQIGVDLTTGGYKVGDGTTSWSGLTFKNGGTSTPSADVQFFLASGTWTMPTGAKFVDVRMAAGGGGGGSGASTASGTASSGGGGGGSSGISFATFRAADLASTVPVTVGGSGAGGVTRPAGGGAGFGGNVGGNSSFGTYLRCAGGFAGGAGQPSAASSAGGAGTGMLAGAAGGVGNSGAAGSPGSTGSNNTGGGAGGGISTTPAAFAGAVGGTSNSNANSAGAAGAINGNGGAPADNIAPGTGLGGGGGGSSITGVGGTGGSGGFPGGGGGGGGSSLSGFGSGPGNAGGNGFVLVITTF